MDVLSVEYTMHSPQTIVDYTQGASPSVLLS